MKLFYNFALCLFLTITTCYNLSSKNLGPARLYVDYAATGSNTGLSWADAFTDLQSALSYSDQSNLTEIWVAKGTYKPSTYPAGCTNCSGTRDYAFRFTSGVKVYGGFVGTETALSQRNLSNNSTTLSGDIGTQGDSTDNTYHVVVFIGADTSTRIDGFTITGGNANSDSYYSFVSNGSMRHLNRSWGAGIYLSYSSIAIQNISFMNNTATQGAGMYSGNSGATITNCVFNKNKASQGGGFYSYGTGSTIINSIFIENYATSGGGMYNYVYSSCDITNSTFYKNNATNGCGIYNDNFTTLNLKNSIIWGNLGGNGVENCCYPFPTLRYSIVQTRNAYVNIDGNTNASDPLFINSSDPDGTDNIFFTTDDGLFLQANSPAINSGNSTDAPTTDITGFTRICEPDRGAYEGRLCNTPTAYALSRAAKACLGDPSINIGLVNSQSCVSYQLKKGGVNIGSPVAGTGAAISFASQTGLGVYTIAATTMVGSCTATMTGSETLAINPDTPSVSIAITTGSSTIYKGTNVVFTATPTNGGSSPTYQWRKRGIDIAGETSSTYSTTTLVDGDTISCRLSMVCGSSLALTVVSSNITMRVNLPIRYVKPTACGLADGSSWDNASADLQAMMNAHAVTQVWVAAGRYKPTGFPTGFYNNGDSRDYAFRLASGVKLYGGFAGTETSFSQRNLGANPTILSGDIGTIGDNSDNCYHVVISKDANSSTLIDGFTITGGNANNNTYSWISSSTYPLFFRSRGGGMYNSYSSANISNVNFTNNSSTTGGGLYNYYASTTILNCLFIANNANIGGGIGNSYSASSVINSTIYGNNAGYGCAINNENWNNSNWWTCINVKNCIIWGNTGGRVLTDDMNCVGVSNSIIQDGSYSSMSSNPLFVNASDPDGDDNLLFTSDDGLSLQASSPAINSGTTTGAPTTDITGFTRICNPDRGAYERQTCVAPSAFSMTGGGINCPNDPSVAIGLANSQVCVNYQLKKNGVNIGSPVAGTGSAISFAAQTETGTYTAEASATFGECTTTMTGSVIVTFNANTPSVTIDSTSVNGFYGKSFIFTATPNDVGSTVNYQWKKNGVNIGSNSNSYSDSTLVNGNIVTCQMSTNVCTSTFTSNSITISGLSTIDAASLHFDGSDDYIAINSASNIPTGNSAYTIEVKIKTTATGDRDILGWGTYGTTSSMNALRLTSDGRLYNYWWSNDLLINPSPINLKDGNWHHIAASWDGTTRKIYIDGILKGSDTPSPPNVGSASNFTIGKGCSCSGNFSGNLDEVKIWNRALSICEIQNNISCELSTGQTGLATYYKFNQGSAYANNSSITQLVDSSGNTNHGTLTNFALTNTSSNWTVGGGVTSGTSCTRYTLTWTGGSSTNWTTATNWSPNCVPSSADNIVIPTTVNIPILPSGQAVQNLTLTGSNNVVIGNNNLVVNAVTGGSDSSYIVLNGTGNLIIRTLPTTTSTTIPVGASTSSYDPITIQPSNSVDFTVRVIPITTGSGFAGGGVNNFTTVVPRQWEITPSSTPGPTVLTFTNGGTSFVPTTPVVGHYTSSGVWEELPATYHDGVWTTTATSFSPFAVGEAGGFESTLPVELLSISVRNEGSANVLDWSTANEINNRGFQIERLSAKNQWDSIGFKNANGKESSYQFRDEIPMCLTGICYYRLRQIDFNGKDVLSKVVSVSINNSNKLKVYPSPTTDYLTIENTELEVFEIYNLLGQRVLNGKIARQIDVSNLPQGTFILKVGAEQATFIKY